MSTIVVVWGGISRAVGCDSVGLPPGGGGATPTRPAPARPTGTRARPHPTAGGAPRARSGGSARRRPGGPRGPRGPRGLRGLRGRAAGPATLLGAPLLAEGRQAPRPPAQRAPGRGPRRLLGAPLLLGCTPSRSRRRRGGEVQVLAHDREQGLGEERQRDVALPAGPAAYLVLVQPHLALGRLKGHLDRPAPPRYLYQRRQLGAHRSEDHVRLQVLGIAQAAPHQTPALIALLQRRDQRQAVPGIPAGGFLPVACREPRPAGGPDLPPLLAEGADPPPGP